MKKQPHLARVLGLGQATLTGLGIIFGAGIYVLVGKAAGIAGNQVWLSFLLAALVAGLTGLSYAELSSMFPKASAEYEYGKNAFGKRAGFLIGWLALIAGIVSVATVALGFGGYFSALTGAPIAWLAVGIIAFCSLIVFLGVQQSVWIAILCTLIETAGLVIIVLLGLPYLNNPALFDFSSFSPFSMLAGAALIFFAFIGFEEITRLSEETKKPSKTIPKALLLAIVISSIVYVLVAATAVSVLGPEKLANSNAPLADVASQLYGSGAFRVLTFTAIVSTFSTVLLILLAASRLMYGISRDKELPELVSYIHPKTQTPLFAILMVALLSSFLAVLGDISLVANATDFVLFLVFIAVNLTVIMLRYKMPLANRPFKVPLKVGKFPVLPLLGILFSALIASAISLEIMAFMLAMTIAGLLYFEFHSRKLKQQKRKVAL
ncbi:MAG: APC family permease [Candidatus Diapherotrites archaeon]